MLSMYLWIKYSKLYAQLLLFIFFTKIDDALANCIPSIVTGGLLCLCLSNQNVWTQCMNTKLSKPSHDKLN